MTRRSVKRATLIAMMAVIAPLASLGAASPAMATPKGIFLVFADCPLSTFKALGVPPSVALCTYNKTTGGEFAIGSTKVPINKPITLQGGGVPDRQRQHQRIFLVAGEGRQQPLEDGTERPGRADGSRQLRRNQRQRLARKTRARHVQSDLRKQNDGRHRDDRTRGERSNPAILDLAALVEEAGTAITLPVRVHLKNPLLGEGCYVGSEAHPIELHLTDGTTAPPAPNKPIKGKLGNPKTEIEKGYESPVILGNTLVDNSFSAPVSEGCGGVFSFLIDPIINSKIGLPSAAGHNTAVLSGRLNTAETEAVVASEKF